MKFLILSVILISIIGTLSHYLYDIFNHNKVIGLFSAVNESTWEHIKIALTPTLLWGLLDGFLYGMLPNYFFAKFISLLMIVLLMPCLFYGYQFITKKDVVIFDIIIFYIVVIVSQLSFYLIARQLNDLGYIVNYIGCIGIFLLFGGYMIHTLMPAKSFLFKDPLTNKYGFKGHTEIEVNKKKVK